ncbi:MAG: 1-deoxy-D-xylulose-5-phosphate synthase, partial [Gammaproteobacteria bacterium]|nr:1-deoxy-D-xylulose-5-phosphate synthase [Gammaproteobacteria bacterium]
LYTGYRHQGPAAVRYPRGTGSGKVVETAMQPLPIGKAEVIQRGSAICILAFGSCLQPGIDVATRLGATLVNMRFVKPLDAGLICEMAESHELLVTVEENAVLGGAGSGVNELLASKGMPVNILNIGIPDRYVEHGSRNDCLEMAGLDADGIFAQVSERLKTIDFPRPAAGGDI